MKMLNSPLAGLLVLLATLIMTSAQLSIQPNVRVHGFQSSVAMQFSDAIIGLNNGENKFAWAVFNDGEDELDVLLLRIQVTGDGRKLLTYVKEYESIKVSSSEEISMPFAMNLPSADYPTLGNMVVSLDIKDEEGRTFSREVFSKRVRFPESTEWSIVSAIGTLIGTALLLGFVLLAYLGMTYGSDRVGEFIASGGKISVLNGSKKRRA